MTCEAIEAHPRHRSAAQANRKKKKRQGNTDKSQQIAELLSYLANDTSTNVFSQYFAVHVIVNIRFVL